MSPVDWSPALFIAIALLVLIGGLAWKQRLAVRTPGMPTRSTPSRPATPDDARDEGTDSLLPDRRDPILGTIAWNGDCGWHNVETFTLGRRDVSVLLLAGPEGPADEHRVWLAAAVARGDSLERDARKLVVEASAGQVAADRVDVGLLCMGADEHGRFIGGLSCATSVAPSPRYVWSRDRWATLSLDRG